MLRQRLVRQSAMSNHSSSDSSTMPSPQPIRRRRNSQDTKMYRQLSSDSLDSLLSSPAASQSFEGKRDGRGRRHSVACGALLTDRHKPTIKSAFNSAVRRVSDACSLFSSAPSSTYNLSTNNLSTQSSKQGSDVILPPVMDTFREAYKPTATDKTPCICKIKLGAHRRFSTDCPPPGYNDATTSWKTGARQKLLTRQRVVSSKGSLGGIEDDLGIQDD